MRIIRNKLVVFGAGKIGRSFIGQIFGTGGYEVVFIDLNKALIEELNARRNYNVVIKSGIESVVNIKNVRGVYVYDRKRVVSEVASAGIVAVSVGFKGLTKICPLLAEGLMERYRFDSSAALDILIAENMRNADEYFEKSLRSMLPVWYPLNNLVGLAETSIGKMVPIMKKADVEEDMLQIFAEPYNSFIFSSKAFKNPIPDVVGLAPKDNIKAWVDRKLFIHNLGHAASAYIGHQYDSGFVFLFEAQEVPEVISFVRETMLQ